MAKSEVPFTCMFTDQTLEQEIKTLKRHDGIVGLSPDEGVLDRLVTITPHLAQIVQQYLTAFNANDGGERSEHYQLTATHYATNIGKASQRVAGFSKVPSFTETCYCNSNPQKTLHGPYTANQLQTYIKPIIHLQVTRACCRHSSGCLLQPEQTVPTTTVCIQTSTLHGDCSDQDNE